MKKLILFLFAGMLMTACSSDDDLPNPDDPSNPMTICTIIPVSGTISEPTLWESGFVYVINGSELSVRSLLTIEPGAIIKIKNARISIYEEGKIIAEGTAEKRIVFTSLADDRFCGDTNGDGSLSQPEKGDWIDLDLHGTIGSVFKYVDIFYAGQTSGGNNRAVTIGWEQSAAFTFDHCRIAHTLYTPASSSYAFLGTSVMKDANVSKFTNNALYDNGRPIRFDTFYELDPSNKFHNPENPLIKNSHNGIFLNFATNGSGLTVNWKHTEVPYVVDYVSTMQTHPSATIHILPNVVVKFTSPSGALQSYNGNVNLDPTAILTSFKDDANGGDTNGDGNSTTPATGDWAGFRYTDGGTNYGWLQGPNILYALN